MKKIISLKERRYTVLYEPIAEGGYQVLVPLLPGLVTYGRTFEEARAMARDAITCHIEALQKHQEPIPSEETLLQEQLTVRV